MPEEIEALLDRDRFRAWLESDPQEPWYSAPGVFVLRTRRFEPSGEAGNPLARYLQAHGWPSAVVTRDAAYWTFPRPSVDPEPIPLPEWAHQAIRSWMAFKRISVNAKGERIETVPLADMTLAEAASVL